MFEILGKAVITVAFSQCLVLLCHLNAANTEDLNLPDPLVVLTSCQQSSLASGSSCQLAIGNPIPTGGFTNAAACSQTQQGNGEWWQAKLPSNLAARVTFARVDLLNNCCDDPTRQLPSVTLDGNDCPLIRFIGSRHLQVFLCNRTGETIRVTGGASQTALTVCRVQVFAEYLASFDVDPPRLQLGNCSQSGSSSCQLAIDGTVEQSLCSSVSPKGWWEARTPDETLLKYIRIHTYMSCCFDFPLSFSVTVDGSECVSYTGTYFTARDFLCDRTGNTVRIVNRMVTANLLLCEVLAYGDAENKTLVDYGAPLRLSSCSQSSSANCRKALDGSTAQTCGDCVRTGAWWLGRFGRLVLVKFVRIFLPNETVCGSQDLAQSIVTVSGKECTRFESSASAQTLFCNATGQAVEIRSFDKSELTICEVQAMGEYLSARLDRQNGPKKHINLYQKTEKTSSLSIRRPTYRRGIFSHCSQSSTSMSGQRCHLALDGSRQRCAQTAAERAAWWQAGLRGPDGRKSHRIGTVIVALGNEIRTDALTSAALRRLRVSVNKQPCRLHSTEHYAGIAFQCNQIGSLIKISNQPGLLAPLMLCEVLVFGWPIP